MNAQSGLEPSSLANLSQTALSKLLAPELAPLFWTPELRDSYSAWWQHVPFAMWITATTKPATLVELGAHNGVSYVAFCEAVGQAKLSTRCYAVDTWVGDPHAGIYDNSTFAQLNAFNSAHYGSFSELIRSSFDAASQHFGQGSIDLLHIDGYHTYEAVSHDFHSWKDKLSPRAVVLFHDTNVRRDDFGVWKFWAEISKEFPSFEFLHGHGLGILAVGATAPQAILDLCALAGEDQIAAFRTRFEVLGTRWSQHQDHQAQKAQLVAQIDALRQTNSWREGDFLAAQAKIVAEHAASATYADLTINYLAQRLTRELRRKNRFNLRRLAYIFNKKARRKHRQLERITNSPFFDAQWYLATYPNVARSKIDPAKHYLEYGDTVGMDPGPFFSSKAYRQRNADVVKLGLNALVHYEIKGRKGGGK